MNSNTIAQWIPVRSMGLRSVLGIKRIRNKGKKVVYYMDPLCDYAGKTKHGIIGLIYGAMMRKWMRFFCRDGDVIITTKKSLKDMLKSSGIRQQIYVVPKSVDTSYFTPDCAAGRVLRQSRNLPADKKLVLFKDDLSDKRRTEEYFKIIEKLPEVQFLWLRDHVQAESRWHRRSRLYENCNNIMMVKALSPDERKKIYQGCDVVLSLAVDSEEDCFLLESMSCGTPVIIGKALYTEKSHMETNTVCLLDGEEDPAMQLRAILRSDLSDLRETTRKFAKIRDDVQIQKIIRQIYDIEGLES